MPKTASDRIQASPESMSSAKDAGLTYVSRHRAGFGRRRKGSKAFSYIDTVGKPMRDPEHLARIKSLVIPPAWTQVWICPSPRGHIQVTGKDARGRLQYRYHPQWRQVRDQAKYGRMMAFGKALPKLRRRVSRDLGRPGLPKEKVVATVIKLLEKTLIRVGNDEYAKSNKSYGLTTIHNKHVTVNGSKMHFEFKGKSGVEHAIDLSDRRLAKVVRQCQELPEQELFEYVDDCGKRHDITSSDINDYLHQVTGDEFTAKDFRTWSGTVLAAIALQEFEAFDTNTQAKRNVVAAIETVARRMGNTKAVCRKCYIHPAVIDTYLDGSLAKLLKERVEAKLRKSIGTLRPEEAAVMALLQERLKGGSDSTPPVRRKNARAA